MRNGNDTFPTVSSKATAAFYPTYEEWKQLFWCSIRCKHFFLFILPMRNGGWREEWKRLRGKILKECRKAFYSTYKEWKLQKIWLLLFQWLAFYPTYKEWKHERSNPLWINNHIFLSYL